MPSRMSALVTSLRDDAGAGRRGEGGVDETRSLPGHCGSRALGWSPAAEEQRTRAAWSNDPSLTPAPCPRDSREIENE